MRKRKDLRIAFKRVFMPRHVCTRKKGNKLNLLIFDGENLYVHKNEAGTMYRKTGGGYVYFSTKPLDDGIWEEVPINRLLIYRDGKQIYEGTAHEHTYVHDEEQMNMLLMGYAML